MTEFKYGDRVVIKNGFFRDVTGRVLEASHRADPRHVQRYTVKILGKQKSFQEDELELAPAKKWWEFWK